MRGATRSRARRGPRRMQEPELEPAAVKLDAESPVVPALAPAVADAGSATASSQPLVTVDHSSLPQGIARPLPAFWPALDLPLGFAHPLKDLVPSAVRTAAEAAEEESWRRLVKLKLEAISPRMRTPIKKGKARALQRLRTREAANVEGTLCKCGKLDVEKYMLQCDGCDVWYHGACVGLSQAQSTRVKQWYCRSCARRQVAAMARTTVYCHCHGPWDGRSFMIQCDACDVWYHGHCVGYSVHSLQRCTEAAFRKYSCPTCTHAATVRLTNAPCAATLSAAEMVAAEAQAAERGGSIARSALVPVPPSMLQQQMMMMMPSLLPPVPSTPVSSHALGKRKMAFSTCASGSSAHASFSIVSLAALGGSSIGSSSSSEAAATSPVSSVAAVSSVSSAAAAVSSVSSAAAAASPVSSASQEGEGMQPQPTMSVCLLLTRLDDDALSSILEWLAPSELARDGVPQTAIGRVRTLLLSVAPTCRRLAALAEPFFRTFCEERQWRPPRRLRESASAWRRLLRQRACAVCLALEARFPVRRHGGGGGGPVLFRLCRDCARREKVQQQVLWHGLQVDALDETGKALFSRQFHMPLFGHANGFSTNLETMVNQNGL